jgi:hypothetical protein
MVPVALMTVDKLPRVTTAVRRDAVAAGLPWKSNVAAAVQRPIASRAPKVSAVFLFTTLSRDWEPFVTRASFNGFAIQLEASRDARFVVHDRDAFSAHWIPLLLGSSRRMLVDAGSAWIGILVVA